MSKRTKITFESINSGNYTVIDPKLIAEANKRIKEAMKPIVKDFNRKMALSLIEAGKLRIN